MIETSARLLRLLSLLQSRRSWSGPDLSQRLEVTGRTLRRDIEKLRGLGYPIAATSGVEGGYQLGAGAALPPLQLEDDEALAVSLSLQTASSAVSGVEEAALRALVKLERVLPVRLRRRANALRASILQLPRAVPAVNCDVLTALVSACSEHTQVRFHYDGRQPARGDAAFERCVEPVGLVSSGYRWYLVAWDTSRQDWRTFRVDRIRGAISPGARFLPRSPPDDGDLKAYVSRSVAVAAYPTHARVVVRAPRDVVAQRVSPAMGVLQAIDAHSCLLATGAHSLEVLAIHLVLLDIDFEVQQPKELVDVLRGLHARLGRALAT